MLTAFVTHTGAQVTVRFVSESSDTTVPATAELMTTANPAAETTTETVVEDTGPNPISPETKELAWGAGSFIVFLILMRLFLFPRIKKGMDARYADIRGAHESADAMKAGAQADVASYEQALASVRAEAAARIDAARQTLDNERQSAVAAANARIAEKRAAADAVAQSAKAAARGQISDAVASVATTAAQIASGRTPDASAVKQAVESAMESAGAR